MCPFSVSLGGQGLYVEFFWLVLLIRYRVEEEKKPFGPKLSVSVTLECSIDHTVGLFRRFALFHPCLDQKVYRVVYSAHLDNRVV